MSHKTVKIAASILSADLANLQSEVSRAETADLLQLDVMDGHFVRNLTFGPPVIKCLKTKLFMEAHLMVENPLDLLHEYKEAGVRRIIFHYEAVSNVEQAVRAVKGAGFEAGIAINPETSPSALFPFLGTLDLVLVMTVHPGFGGQSFIQDSLRKIRELRKRFHGMIEVDGGINAETAGLCAEAGADVLVAGSFIFKNKEGLSPAEAVQALRNAVL